MRIIAPLLLPIVLCACVNEPLPLGLADGGGPHADAAARTCRDLPGDVQAWIDAHATCVSDGDCVVAPTRCGLPNYCGAYLHKAGLTGLMDFTASWDAQVCGATIDCAPCPATVPPARCIGGVCKPKP